VKSFYGIRDEHRNQSQTTNQGTLLDHRFRRGTATRTSMGMAARARAVGEFDYSVLVARLAAVLHGA